MEEATYKNLNENGEGRVYEPTTNKKLKNKGYNQMTSSNNNDQTNVNVNLNRSVETVEQKQPKYPYPTIKGSSVHTYLIWSVVNVCFFSLIFGACALVYSMKTKHRLNARLFQKAYANSRKALMFNIIALCVGLIGTLITVLILVLIERTRTDGGIFICIVVFRVLF